jgi:hypothetical protein
MNRDLNHFMAWGLIVVGLAYGLWTIVIEAKIGRDIEALQFMTVNAFIVLICIGLAIFIELYNLVELMTERRR